MEDGLNEIRIEVERDMDQSESRVLECQMSHIVQKVCDE